MICIVVACQTKQKFPEGIKKGLLSLGLSFWLSQSPGVKSDTLLTNKTFAEIMTNSETIAKVTLKKHIKSLEWHIRKNTLNQYDSYTTWMDASANQGRSINIKNGLKNMLNTLDSGALTYKIGCYKNASFSSYTWTSSYPIIFSCNQTEVTFKGEFAMYALFHEISHFLVPYGMNTSDHTYSAATCKRYAINNPTLAVDTAHCINHFLADEPDEPPVNILPIILLLLDDVNLNDATEDNS